MAIRIQEAVPQRGVAHPGPIPASLYDKARHGVPRCPECGTEVTHTSAHTKNGGSTVVDAHFGLRKGRKHGPGCKYDIEATLRKIVATSRELRLLGQRLVDYVGDRDQGAVEFGLHVLLTGLEAALFPGAWRGASSSV